MFLQETQILSGKDVENLVSNQSLWENAIRKADITAANKYALRMTRAVHALRETEAGRSELEKLLSDPKPNLRLWAAGSVMAWAPDIALPILAELLHEPLGKEAALQESVDIRTNAKGYLARHFGLHPSDLRELPGRLADIGIDLPDDTVSQLRR
jgi:hypothetical protein